METLYTPALIILSLRPNADFTMNRDYESLVWLDDTQVKPTEKEYNDAVTAWNIEYDAQEYARNRQVAYPSTGDQLDMIYKDTKNSTTTHADAVEAIKTKWPKDNSGPIE
jgi:hypothetical protein